METAIARLAWEFSLQKIGTTTVIQSALNLQRRLHATNPRRSILAPGNCDCGSGLGTSVLLQRSNSRCHRIPLGSPGRSYDPGKRIHPPRRSCSRLNAGGVLPRTSAASPKFSCTRARPTSTSISWWVLPLQLELTRKPSSSPPPTKQNSSPRSRAKAAIRTMSDADLEKLSNGITERGVLLYIVQPIAQHLGQQIAYARSIGVVPPWTLDPPRKD